MNNWGIFALPKTISVHQMRHQTGHYFAMRYDSSSTTQDAVRNMLRLDPRMIRHSSVKIGDGKLETLATIKGPSWQE